VKLEFSGNEITRAGDALIQPGFSEEDPEEFAHAMEVLSYCGLVMRSLFRRPSSF